MPRILLLSSAVTFRGGERQASILLEGIRNTDWEAVLAAPQNSQLFSQMKESGIMCSPLPRRSELSPLSIAETKMLIRKIKPDILHCNDAHSLSRALWVKTEVNRPAIVAHRRMMFPISSRWKYTKLADGIIAISNCVAASLSKRGVPSDKVEVIYSSVHPSFLRSPLDKSKSRDTLNLPRDKKIILYSAALTGEKGHRLLLDAFSLVKKQYRDECLLVLAGSGKKEGEYRSKAPSGVFFTGKLAGERLRSAYCAADVFAFPGEQEGLGTASLEAQACGVPVVAVDRGGVAETVQTGETGILCDANAEAFAACILKLLDSPDEACRLGRNAREAVGDRFSPASMVTSTVAYYERLKRSNAEKESK